MQKHLKSASLIFLVLGWILSVILSVGCDGEQLTTPAPTNVEIVEDTVRQYHETHTYSEYDFFVCSDMAIDVWNMIKTKGIDAQIAIGNVNKRIESIAEADHAWVLAETSPSEHLALETTGGYIVWKDDNHLYYEGWFFDSPREFKRYQELRREYNIRVNMIEQLNNKALEAYQKSQEELDKYKQLANELDRTSIFAPSYNSKLTELIEATATLGKYSGKVEQLNELMDEQKHELEKIVSEMKGLTS